MRPSPGGPTPTPVPAGPDVVLYARTHAGLSLHEAAATLHAHPTHLIRCFKRTYGLPPHAYLTGKRIEHARRLLLDGHRPAEVASAVGLYDQAHLNRHFTRHVGTTPARYQRTRTGSHPTTPRPLG
ncbi:helix-turn-helix transcriptional regulator [Streptomyces sp. DT224]|uniref:helix-turn-helix transcriptional regulator n=1 Tax=Streptomyces sp. DT224 TaxID=3393426 RepID=UPI003CF28BCA